MYKPISNFSGNKTSICSQVEAGKIIADKLYCCAKDNKNCSLSSDCVGSNYQVAKCHNLNTLDACKRTDLAAIQVCGGLKNSLFCLSVDAVAKENESDYYRFPKASEWMVNRTTEAETNIITVCDDGTSYRPCNTSNPIGTIANLTCGDLFQNEHRCQWRNITNGQILADIPRKPPAIIGLAAGMGVLGLISITLVVFFISKWRRRKEESPPSDGLAFSK
ncbi:9493_t:CDS:2 [Ambispora gerdemannii]|uniref:9493_t:CDS:1 n=1 Tax=Ambispora gerdemannii TaxID=144530 RepID=A0A9N9DF58_9GLOM|nr:9493_t:CDS:2 [Ambispora gerdemannii]